MKIFNRAISAAFMVGLGAFVLSGCAARGGANAKRAEAVLESKQNASVKGSVTLEDHHGVMAYGKLTGLRADRGYRVQIHEKGDCSARNASSAGNVVGVVSKDGKSLIENGKVDGHLTGNSKFSDVVGKSVVVVSVDAASGKEFRVACGTIKAKAYSGKTCADCKCDGKKADCKCDKGCDCGKKMEKKADAAPKTARKVARKGNDSIY